MCKLLLPPLTDASRLNGRPNLRGFGDVKLKSGAVRIAHTLVDCLLCDAMPVSSQLYRVHHKC
jgi:hypothetical protein